jgi:hypothetical protein
MQRAMGWFGLVFMVWSLAGLGLLFFWNSTSAKRTLTERIAAGEALERWVITESEYAELNVVDGEFWIHDRVYDVIHAESINDGLVVIQVFDDSYETGLAKLGRKLLRRKVGDTQSPPLGIDVWASLRAVVPNLGSSKIIWFCEYRPHVFGEIRLKEARWRSGVLRPPEGEVRLLTT